MCSHQICPNLHIYTSKNRAVLKAQGDPSIINTADLLKWQVCGLMGIGLVNWLNWSRVAPCSSSWPRAAMSVSCERVSTIHST